MNETMKNKIVSIFLAALLSLCAALLVTNTWAEDSKTVAQNIWTRDKLTGDWWGCQGGNSAGLGCRSDS